MKLEYQVCSYELAKKLKELGVKQDSLFGWVTVDRIGQNDTKEYVMAMLKIPSFNPVKNPFYSAFTVSEIGEMLPSEVDTFKGNHEWKWECSFHSGNDYHSKSGAKTEADARAKMLIYLLENGLMKNE